MRYLFTFILLLVLSFKAKANQRSFEQAYAPIFVDKITIFIPIENLPSNSRLVSLKETDNGYLIEWDQADGATFYYVEQLVNGVWQQVGDDVTGLSMSISGKSSSQFRVVACGRYGCSKQATHQNVIANGDLQLSQFSLSKPDVTRGQGAILTWKVHNASSVKIVGSNGSTFKNLPLSGSLNVFPSDFTNYTLVSSGFGQTLSASRSVVVTEPRSMIQTPVTNYIEPLRNMGYDVIARSLLALPQGVMFSTHDEKIALVNKSGVVLWEKQLEGVAANMGNYDADTKQVFISVSKLNGAGQTCALNVNNINNYSCLETTSSAIARPVVIELAPSSNSETSVPSKLVASVDMKGNLYVMDKLSLQLTHAVTKLPTEVTKQGVTANIAAVPNTSDLIMRVSEREYASISITEAQTGCNSFSSCTQSVMSLFSDDSEADEQTTPKLEVKVNWVKEHKE
ncbi:hypothetical protein N474_19315 [Pseudoalteromonas luteoviolacea CPMOR-2]|uniref:hypothetical protein n=1 Tax=Pseudoalteromonas luteoviolacea TaxID=43657 RepID=UPI0007B0A94C|nr:hypothetical protein [Pseudoalteromonas luteoviolacea]KZN53722.1 hypothetical protein N474_19315 [Pseudoalteromonas luteoviolacea CPMOR-2]